jgi:RNA polymerase sigma factor (sigma-70 family)
MSTTVEPSHLEALLTQAPWARRLAYRLVHEAEAPDLLQEAWISASRSVRPADVPWPAWFGGMVRILGLRHRRGEARRRAREREADREQAAAPPAAGLPPDALLERAQLQRLLSDLVLELSEPWRSTVLLRYEEGLSAAQIGRRLGIPAGTVRWRLKRALDLLRERLDQRSGPRRAWMLALAPLAGPRPPPALARPGARLAIATLSAALATGALIFFWTVTGHPGRRAPGAPAAVTTAVREGPAAERNHDPNPKETNMKRIAPVIAVALGLGAQADAGAAGPLPASKVARYQVPLGAAPIRGPAGAKVTILEFTDYECPFCADASKDMEQLLAESGREVRFQVINMPLPFHHKAPLAARAALAAAQQGKYWEMHARLFGDQQHLDRAGFEGHARALGLDLARFRADLDGPEIDRLMEIDQATAQSVKTSATPTFFVNGRMLQGSRPLPQWRALLAEELAYADQVLASGVARPQLYNAIVARAPGHVARAGVPRHPLVQKAVDKCLRDPKLLQGLKGVTVTTGGAFTIPKGAQPSDEQMDALAAWPTRSRTAGSTCASEHAGQ